MTRLYAFETIKNFRDFGQYETLDSRRVAAKKLFRSAHLADLSDPELSDISDMGINLIVDLRHAPERARQPNRLSDERPPLVFEYPEAEEHVGRKMAPHEAFMQNDLSIADDARAYMMRSYSARPDDAGFRTIFSNTLKHMAASGDSILIHCAAGKDRTGTLAAIILAALGVDSETILEDFMLTMEAVDIDSMLEPAAKFMEARFGRPYDPESLRPMFGVEPEYLLAALNTIGDMEAYLTDGLHITKNERKALVDAYTISA